MSDKYTLERGGIVVRRHADGVSFEIVYPAFGGDLPDQSQREEFKRDIEDVRILTKLMIELTDSFDGYRKKEP